MSRLVFLAALVCLAAPLAAQGRQDPEQLREQVVQRFLQNYRTQAGLTEAQFARLETGVRRRWESRRGLQQRERELLEAVGGQLRPGVGADVDSVTRLLDALESVQAERIAGLRQEQAELREYLTPVQRAQLVLAFTRLERQIEDLVRRRMEPNPPPRRPE